MMKYTYIVAFIIATLAPNLIYAQQVKSGGGIIYIDCTTVPYNARRVNAVQIDHNEESESNCLPKKFEVAKTDAANPSPNYPLTWHNAKIACSNYGDGDNNKWRLPTQREAIVMAVLQAQLERQTGFTEFKKKDQPADTMIHYWCSTKPKAYVGFDAAWDINFINNGLVYYNNTDGRSFHYRARCVRDIQ